MVSSFLSLQTILCLWQENLFTARCVAFQWLIANSEQKHNKKKLGCYNWLVKEYPEIATLIYGEIQKPVEEVKVIEEKVAI